MSADPAITSAVVPRFSNSQGDVARVAEIDRPLGAAHVRLRGCGGEFCIEDPVELDANSDSSPQDRHRVRDIAFELDADSVADRWNIYRDVAADELGRRGVSEGPSETKHRDLHDPALLQPGNGLAFDSADRIPTGWLAWYSAAEIHDVPSLSSG